jgi:signal transduction histidine kinase/Tfp pilus assembly protein PilF
MFNKLLFYLSIVTIGTLWVNGACAQLQEIQLLESLETAKPQERVQLLNHLSELNKSINAAQSRIYALRALEESQASGDTTGWIMAKVNLGEYYIDQGFYDSAMVTFREAQAKAEKQQSAPFSALVNSKIGVVYYFQHEYDEALQYLFKARDLYQEEDNLNEVAKNLSTIGYVYGAKGWFERSLEFRLKALDIRQKAGDRNELAKSLNSLGDFYKDQQNFYRALKYYWESYEVSKELDNPRGIAISLNNLAVIYNELGDVSHALELHQQALKIKQKLGNRKELAISLFNLGDLYAKSGQDHLAFGYFSQAIALYREIDNYEQIAMVLGRMAKLHARAGKPQQARKLFENALDTALIDKGIAPNLLLELLKNRSDFYFKLGDQATFMQSHRQYIALRDSLADKSIRSTGVLEIQQRYEDQKAQERIALIQKENTIKELQLANAAKQRNLLMVLIAFFVVFMVMLMLLYITKMRTNGQLQAQNALISASNQALAKLNDELQASQKMLQESNETKDKLFAIISHDIRSPLDSLSALVQLVLSHADSLKPDEIQTFFGKIQTRIANLNEFMNNLLKWAQLQSHAIVFNPVVFALDNEIKQIVEIYQHAAHEKKIRLNILLLEELQICADQNMMQFVIRNLLANAIKFTPTGGAVTIDCTLTASYLQIAITDNGVGMSKEEIEQIFTLQKQLTKQGTSKEQGTGLGLLVCKEFLEKHHAFLEVVSEEGKGSTFTIFLPLSMLVSNPILKK